MKIALGFRYLCTNFRATKLGTISKISDKSLKGHVALLATNLIFGVNTPLTKSLLSDGVLSPLALNFLRFSGGFLLFWTASLFLPREKVSWKDLGLLGLASFFGLILNQIAFLVGLTLTSPVDASIISTIVPIITMLLAALFLREPITFKKVGGVLLGCAGAVWLILEGSHHSTVASMKGNMLCLLSTTSYAVYLSAFRPLIRRYHPVTLMKWMFLYAIIAGTFICRRDIAATDFSALTLANWGETLYLVVLATFVCYLLIPVGQRLLRPTIVSMYNYIQPLVTSLVAVALGLGTLGWTNLAAALLIFTGVYVVTISKSREQLLQGQARAINSR